MIARYARDGLSACSAWRQANPWKGEDTVLETRNYELMFIVSPELGEEALEAVLDRVQRYLETAEAQVVSRKGWGLRRLAYTLKGQREGRYYLVLFTAATSVINELDRNLRLIEGVLRHMITRMETEMPEPSVEAPVEAAPEPTPEPVEETPVEAEAEEPAPTEESTEDSE